MDRDRLCKGALLIRRVIEVNRDMVSLPSRLQILELVRAQRKNTWEAVELVEYRRIIHIEVYPDAE